MRYIIAALYLCLAALLTLTDCKILGGDAKDLEQRYEAVIFEYKTKKNPNGESVMCGITKNTVKPKEDAEPLNFVEIMFAVLSDAVLTCRDTADAVTVSCKVSEEHSNSDKIKEASCSEVKKLCDDVKGTLDSSSLPWTNQCNIVAFLPSSLSENLGSKR